VWASQLLLGSHAPFMILACMRLQKCGMPLTTNTHSTVLTVSLSVTSGNSVLSGGFRSAPRCLTCVTLHKPAPLPALPPPPQRASSALGRCYLRLFMLHEERGLLQPRSGDETASVAKQCGPRVPSPSPPFFVFSPFTLHLSPFRHFFAAPVRLFLLAALLRSAVAAGAERHPTRLLLFGDSLTEGVTLPGTCANPYAYELARLSGCAVTYSGHRGETAEGLSEKPLTVLLHHLGWRANFGSRAPI
jgi:hypothetical protein